MKFDVHTGMFASPFMMRKGTEDGERREKRLCPLARNEELLSLHHNIPMWNSKECEKSKFCL